MKKNLILLLATLGCLVTFALGLWQAHPVMASTQFGDQFITNAALLDDAGNPATNVGEFDTTQAHYDFQIPDGQVIQAGDTMQVTLPTQLVVSGDVQFEILDENGVVIANTVVDKATGTVLITFTDYYTNYPTNREGSFNIRTQWNLDNITIDTEVPLDWGNQGITNVYVGPNANPDSNEQLWKWGTIDANDPTLIHWTMRVNYQRLTIQNAVLTDTLGPNQTLIENTIHASHVVYGEGNQYTVIGAVPSSQITINNQQSFQINLGTLDDTVLVNYDSRATDGGAAASYTNQASLSGDQYETSTVAVHTASTGGDGDGSGTNQSVVLTKKDATDATKVLKGAHFKLVDSQGQIVKSDLVTDQSGQIKVAQLAVGDYQFIETQAPAGYQLDATPVQFKIIANQDQRISVVKTNQPVVPGQVTLHKQDQTTHQALAGAVFDLRTAAGQVVQSGLQTDKTGQLTVAQLPIGDYCFVETQAPAGYQLDATPVSFTISQAQLAVTVVKYNQLRAVPKPKPEVPAQPLAKTPTPSNKTKQITTQKQTAKQLPQTSVQSDWQLVILGLTLIGMVAYLSVSDRTWTR